MRFVLVIILIPLFVSCNPSAGLEPTSEVVKLKATLNDVNESILLGDTIKISLNLTDTITSNSGKHTVQSLQHAFYGMRIFKVDTANQRGIFIQPPLIWPVQGNITTAGSFAMNTNAKPYGSVIYFKPTEKGIYCFEVIPQPGDLKMNNGYWSKLLVDFDVPDKHYNILSMIAPYFGGQSYYNAYVQMDSEGFGVYFFKVN